MLSKIDGVTHSYSTEVVSSQRVAALGQTFADALTEESSTTNGQVSSSATSSRQFFGGWTASIATHKAAAMPELAPPSAPAAAVETQAPAETSQPFVPQFLTNVQVLSAYGDSWPLNSAYFASKETAQYIADKFGTGQVVQTSLLGTGGPYAATADPYEIVLANGAKVNAGLLADYYVRMPEAQFPGLADTMIQMAVAKAEQFNS